MYHIIINPASRSGKGKAIWENQIKPLLEKENVEYQPYFSQKAGDVAALADKILSEHPTDTNLFLIVLGGDGTVDELLQGLTEPERVILGYIPTGSSNDLARDLGFPHDPAAMLQTILHEPQIHTMDLGCVDFKDGSKRYFAVSCGIGYDAAVCEETFRSKAKKVLNKVGLGKLCYLAIALKQLFATKEVALTLTLDDNKPIQIPKVLFVAGMIHRYEGGGFQFCPDAKDDDGILELCTAGNLPKLLILFALPTAFFGKHYFFKGITGYRAKTYRIESSSPLWVHTDGEIIRNTKCITVSCQEKQLKMVVPKPAERESLPAKHKRIKQ